MMTALPKRSQGSHDPDTRSGSPSGLCVVALITAAAAAAMISGNMTEYTPLARRPAQRDPQAHGHPGQGQQAGRHAPADQVQAGEPDRRGQVIIIPNE